MPKNNNDSVGSIKISSNDDTSVAGGDTNLPLPEPAREAPENTRDVAPSSDPDRRKIPSPATGKLKGLTLVFFFCFVLYNIIGFLAIPYALRTVIPSWISQSTQRSVTVGSAHFNPFTFKLRLRNTIIGPNLGNPEDQIDPIFSASSIETRVSPLSLFLRRLNCSHLSVDGLFLHIVRNNDKKYNIYDLLRLKPVSTFPFVQFPFAFSLQNISITNSRLFLDDLPAMKKHRMEQINITLPLFYHSPHEVRSHQNFSAKGQFLNPKFSAVINGSPIDLTGKTKIDGDKFKANLQLQLNDIDLPDYLSYLPAQPPFFIDKGRGDILMELSFSTDADQKQNLEIEIVSLLRDVRLRDQFNNISLLPAATFKGTLEPLVSRYFFNEISLVEPEIHLSRLADGQWTLPGITGKKDGTPLTNKPQTALKKDIAGKNPFLSKNFTFDNLSIKNGKLSFVDQKTEGGFAENLSEVSLTLTKETSKNKPAFPFSLTGVTSKESKVAIQGELFFSPFKIMGLFVADNLNLQPFSNYFPFPGPVRLKQGKIDKLESRFVFTPSSDKDKPAFVFQNSTADLSGFILSHQDNNWLSLPQAHLTFKKFDPSHATISDITLQADDPEIFLHWDKENYFNWQLFSKPGKDKTNMQFSLSSLNLQNSLLHIQNNFLPTPVINSLKNVQIKASNISTEKGQKGKFSFQTQNHSGTSFSLSGPLALSPFSGLLSLSLKNYKIDSAPQLITDWLDLGKIAGLMDAKGDVSLARFSYDGSITLHHFNAAGNKGENLFACNKAKAANIHLSYQPFSLTVPALDLMSPSLDWIIKTEDSANHKFPFFRTKSADQTLPYVHKGQIKIDTINITDGMLALTDQRPTPRFTTHLNLDGTLSHLVNETSGKMHFDLDFHGEDDMRGKAKGDIGLFGSSIYVDLAASIQNQPAAKFSPYLESLLGHRVKNGFFTFSTDYHQENDQIRSKNTIRASGLVVENHSQSTIQLPLTLALLSDQNGEITFNFPVIGTPSEPAYSFPAALGRVLRNLALKTSVSPFTQLHTSLPEFEKIPDHLLFSPGESTLSPENEKHLNILSQILVQRPKLTVTLKGFAGAGQDKDALLLRKKENALHNEILRQNARLSELSKTYGNEEISPVPPQEETLSSSESSSLTVQKSELLQLAKKREKAVHDYLVTHFQIGPSRVIADTTGYLVPPDAPGRQGYRVDLKLGVLN